MAEKGKKIGMASNVVFRYSDTSETNVVHKVNISGSRVEGGKEYFVEVYKNQGQNGQSMIAEFKSKISKGGNHVSIPKSVVLSTDQIQPGRTVNIYFFEVDEPNTQEKKVGGLEDSAEVLDRATPNLDSSSSTKLDSRITSTKAVQHVKKRGGECEVKFRNTRTGEETISATHAGYDGHGNKIHFPVSAQKKIGADIDDLIEIIRVDKENQNNILGAKQNEKIEEIHDMVSEMYDAYLSAKDE